VPQLGSPGDLGLTSSTLTTMTIRIPCPYSFQGYLAVSPFDVIGMVSLRSASSVPCVIGNVPPKAYNPRNSVVAIGVPRILTQFSARHTEADALDAC